MMVKATCLMYSVLACLAAFAQANPLDTSYYGNKSIRSILYQNDFKLTGYEAEAFYSPGSQAKKAGARLADTLYEHQPGWPVIYDIPSLNKNLVRTARHYLPDSSCIEKNIFTGGTDPLVFSFSSVTIYFKKEGISVTYHYKQGQAVAFYIAEEDFFSMKKSRNLVHIISEKDMKNKYQEFLLTGNRKIRIEHTDTLNRLSRILFMDQNGTWKGACLEFYRDAMPKQLGRYDAAKRVGTWYEWDEKGFLRASGHYGSPQFDAAGNATFLKDLAWTYYDETGKVTRKETWKNGVLIH